MYWSVDVFIHLVIALSTETETLTLVVLRVIISEQAHWDYFFRQFVWVSNVPRGYHVKMSKRNWVLCKIRAQRGGVTLQQRQIATWNTIFWEILIFLKTAVVHPMPLRHPVPYNEDKLQPEIRFYDSSRRVYVQLCLWDFTLIVKLKHSVWNMFEANCGDCIKIVLVSLTRHWQI